MKAKLVQISMFSEFYLIISLVVVSRRLIKEKRKV